MNLDSLQPGAQSILRTRTLYFNCRRLGGAWQLHQHLHARVVRMLKWLDGVECAPVDVLFAAADFVVELQAPVDLAALAPADAQRDRRCGQPSLPRFPRSGRSHNHTPLIVAAAVIYRAFIEEKRRRTHTKEDLEKHLDVAARLLATVVPIYRLDHEPPTIIGSQTLTKGVFADGGRMLRFADGRAVITALGIGKTDLELIDKLASVVTDVRQADLWRKRFWIRPSRVHIAGARPA